MPRLLEIGNALFTILFILFNKSIIRGIRGMMIIDELRKLQLPWYDNILSNCYKWVGVKKVRKSVLVMQRRFCVYVCARITRQRVR